MITVAIKTKPHLQHLFEDTPPEKTKTGRHTIHKEPKINNGRPFSIYVPPGTVFSKPIQLFLYFHGDGGSHVGSTFNKLKKFAPAGQNIVLVIPNLNSRRNSRKIGPTRSNVSGMSSFIKDVLKKLPSAPPIASYKTARPMTPAPKLPEIASLLIYGWSGGGSAMSRALSYIPEEYIRKSRVIYADATFGTSAKHTTPAALRRLKKFGVPKVLAITGPKQRSRELYRRIYTTAKTLARNKELNIKHVPGKYYHALLRVPPEWREAWKAAQKLRARGQGK